MGARAIPPIRRQLAAAVALLALVAGAFFFWLGIPLLTLWGLSKATESGTEHFVLGLVVVPAAMAAFVPILFWLNGLYARLTATGAPQAARRRSRGPLEYLLAWSLLVSVVALLVWFFLFAENPPRRFI